MRSREEITIEEENHGYEWTALSVTTVGALLASIQGSALLIALPEILTRLQTGFITIMWVLLGYLLITTALVPVIGRLATAEEWVPHRLLPSSQDERGVPRLLRDHPWSSRCLGASAWEWKRLRDLAFA